MKYISITIVILLAITGCEKKKSQADIDDEIITNYLSDNNLEAEKHSSGLYYIIKEEGAGGHPDIDSTVEVKYKGYLTNNQVFDETTGGQSILFPLYDLIPGWQIALPMLQKGGKAKLFVPSALGYGSRAAGSIPANSVLIFDIELVNFSK